jgi:hypothetical protein
VVSFPKSKTQKTIEQIAPFYKYNPHTPYYFKHKDDWELYLKDCSGMSKGNVKAKISFLHKRLGHWWCEHRKERHTLEYYAKHYSDSATDEDKRNPALMPRRLQHAVNTINKRLEKNWVKPPPAMASHNYWESFFYNCMDLNVLEKLDIILIELLKFIDKKKEKPEPNESRDKCLNYLEKRKTEPAKKRTW